MSAGVSGARAHLALRVLSDTDVTRVHDAALARLGEEGPAVATAVARAPRAFLLGGRKPEYDVLADRQQSWLAAGGEPALMLPLGEAEERPATSADLEAACRLADGLPEVALLMGPPVRATDLTPLAAVRRCLAATRKHVCLTSLRSPEEARRAAEMALQLAEGSAALRARPPLSLVVPAAALPAALVFARAGLPVGVVPDAGGPAPGTDLADALVRQHAGVLAACRAVQAAAPGAAFFAVVQPSQVLPGAGNADAALFALGAVQLAGHVGLPVLVGALETTAGASAWESCAENALTSLALLSSCGVVAGGAGTLARGRVFSPRQLVMDAEVFSWNARIAAGIPVDEETLALDVVKQVGIGGNYLGQRHTRRHMRSVWRPRLLDRTPWDAWLATGALESPELAEAAAAELLATHEVPPLRPDTDTALERLAAGGPGANAVLPLTRGVVE